MTAGAKILTIGGMFAAGLFLFGYRKKKDIDTIVENLEFSIANIGNIRLPFPNVEFTATINLINNSHASFGVNFGGAISISEIRVYDGNHQYMGKANVAISGVELPAMGVASIPDIQFSVDALKAVAEVGGNIDSYMSGNLSRLNYEIDITVFGKTFTI